MLRIRLRRQGAKKAPSYRIVVADARKPRDGGFKEIIGHYDPMPNPSIVKIDVERAEYWIARGAQPSDPVKRMLKKKASVEAVKSDEGTD
jgi:small subunit ribosomal protein S16